MSNVIIVLCAFIAVSYAQDPIFDNIENARNTFHKLTADYMKFFKAYGQHNIRRIEDISSLNRLLNATIKKPGTPIQEFSNFIVRCVAEQRNVVEGAELSINLCKSSALNRFIMFFSKGFRLVNDLKTYIERDFESELAQCGTGSNINRTCVKAVISKTRNVYAAYRIQIKKKMQEITALVNTNIQQLTDCITNIEGHLLHGFLNVYIQQ